MLFSEKISVTRLEWIADCINLFLENNQKFNLLEYSQDNEFLIKFFLTGDSIFSLIDTLYLDLWLKIFKHKETICYVDSWDLELFGLKKSDFNVKISNKLHIEDNKKTTPLLFWETFLKILDPKKYGNSFGFLELKGPYMSRTSVHILRALRASLREEISPELYAYLDGVHLGHDSQRPSEFENIANGLINLKKEAEKRNLNLNMFACSRCGTARGYIKQNNSTGYIESEDAIPSFIFCNLNKIIDKFELNNIIVSPNSILIKNIQFNNFKKNKSNSLEINNRPPIIILITHSPYGTEYTFGGISFAVACANHNIPTKVIFIENGIYSLIGSHNIRKEDGIFNIQEIVEATFDMEYLEYYAHKPSLDKRVSLNKIDLEGIKLLSTLELSRFLFDPPRVANLFHKRIIFF
ncbi:MAG: hypothetical protein ACFFAO_04420 [Candidatus Hermodarchaeota archaeon]